MAWQLARSHAIVLDACGFVKVHASEVRYSTLCQASTVIISTISTMTGAACGHPKKSVICVSFLKIKINNDTRALVSLSMQEVK
jgi:hypothetical protein